jgi:hypothetical protein
MKSFGLALCFVFLVGPVFAQVGINTSYRFNNARDWNLLNPANGSVTELPGDNFAFGLDYAIRLKGLRLEIVPEANYARYQVRETDFGQLNQQTFSGFLNFNLYVLDLKGDCDCPTFRKSGNVAAKGLYLSLSPGISLFDSEIAMLNGTLLRGRALAPSLALGFGLDLGLSEKLTITPFGGFRYFPEARWFGLEEALLLDPTIINYQTNNESPISQIYAGLRLGFHLSR